MTKDNSQDADEVTQGGTGEPVPKAVQEEMGVGNEARRPTAPHTPRQYPSTGRSGKTVVLPFRTPKTAPPALHPARSPPRTARRRGHGPLFNDPRFYRQLQAIAPDHQLLAEWKRTKTS